VQRQKYACRLHPITFDLHQCKHGFARKVARCNASANTRVSPDCPELALSGAEGTKLVCAGTYAFIHAYESFRNLPSPSNPCHSY